MYFSKSGMDIKSPFDRDCICRVCTQSGAMLYSIFEETSSDGGSITISRILSECTRFPVTGHDRLPQQICGKCLNAARNAYNFKRQTEEAYCRLRILLDATWSPTEGEAIALEQATQTDKSSVHQCESCAEKFFDIFDLREHRTTSHRNEGKECRVCSKRFLRLRQLQIHLAQEHPNEGVVHDITCHLCQRTFGRKDHLKRHLHGVHQFNLEQEDESLKVFLEEPEIYCGKVKSLNPENSHWSSYGQDRFSIEENVTEAINPFEHYDSKVKCDNDSEREAIVQPEMMIKVESNDDCGQAYTCSTEKEAQKDDDFQTPVTSDAIKRTAKSLPNDMVELPQKNKVPKRCNGKQSQRHTNIENPLENRCVHCQRTFTRHCHLLRHMLSHSDEKRHACTYCEKRFTRSDHLRNHIRRLHNAKEYKCDLCSSAFSHKDHLERHRETRHSDDPHNSHKLLFDCEFCNKKFTTKSYLVKHKLLHTDRLFGCKHCPETFAERQVLREHEKTHDAGRNFLCNICGESFQRNDYLKMHMRRHSGEKPYKCQFCEKAFPRATDLKIHERYHTGTKPNICTLCGKGFHRSYSLTIHMRTHTGEKPYRCSHCPQAFAQSNDLKAHTRRHTGERFRCDTCGAAFLQRYGLRAHASTAHGIELSNTTGRVQKINSLNFVKPDANNLKSNFKTRLTKHSSNKTLIEN